MKVITNAKYILLLALSFTLLQCGNKDQAAANANSTSGVKAKPVSNNSTVAPNTQGASRYAAGVVKGNLKNAENLQVFFDKSTIDNSNQVIARSTVDADGNFSIPLEDGFLPGIYRLRIGVQKNNLIFTGQETEVTVKGDLNSLRNYGVTIEGSTATNEYFNLMKQFGGKTPNEATAKTALSKVQNPFVKLFAASKLFPTQNGLEAAKVKIAIQKEALASLKSSFPASDYVMNSENAIKQEESQIKAQEQQLAARAAAEKIKVGEMAPNLTLKDPNGKSYSLSDLKGKVVLLDFWASWCRPCRLENPNVVAAYNEYNKKGFEVFSVSLDGINPKVLPRLKTQEQKDQQLASSKSRWEKAIESDGLIWKYHVSDLKHWGSPAAKTYGVSGIPKTFLIDRDGRISAVNPRGHKLVPAIEKLL